MQRIKLDINPKGEIPVLYASQCDKGRLFEVELVEGDQAYNVPLEYSVQLNVRKTDSKLVTTAPINIVDNILRFSTTEQMTACAGENIASVTLKDTDDYVITTLYFLISIQRDVLAGGLNSASEIHNLEQQIAAIVPEVIGDDYYNKTQTDELLANKANMSDLVPLASKAELTQAILDEDISLKNWVSSNFATPGYVNERIFNILPVGSASGNPCTFTTDLADALVSLTADIVCGGGGGTPSVPVPLVPHNALNLDVNGNTFTVAFGQTVYGGVYDKSGRLTITHGYVDLGDITYSLLSNTSTRQAWSTSGLVGLIKPPMSGNDTFNAISSGFTAVSYNATWLPATFSSLTATGDQVVFCVEPNAYADAKAMKTAMSGVQFAYELATPIIIDVPSISVFAENGVNNIVSDGGGDVNVSYKDTIQHYIDERL